MVLESKCAVEDCGRAGDLVKMITIYSVLRIAPERSPDSNFGRDSITRANL
jgi:hypothetical protein